MNKEWKVLDFGTGTGTIPVELSSFVKHIVGIDLSKGMLEVFKQKIKEKDLKNITIKQQDIFKEDLEQKDFDLIITSMTFHHIENIKSALEKLKKYLKEEGYIVIIDLDKEDGTFHSSNLDVKHFGFSKEEIDKFFKESGLDTILIENFDSIKKERNGKERDYPLFIAIAKK